MLMAFHLLVIIQEAVIIQGVQLIDTTNRSYLSCCEATDNAVSPAVISPSSTRDFVP